MKRVWPMQIAIFLLIAGFYVILVKGLYIIASPAVAWVYNALGLFLIFQAYLFAYMLATHILSPLLKKLPGKAVAVAGLVICLGFVVFGFIQAQSFTVTNHEIAVRGLASPISIMHIPDLHLGTQRSQAYLQKVVDAINQRAPDIVLYNGDLVDSHVAFKPELFAIFKNVKAQQYFTTGNHEFYLDTEKALELIEGAGIKILRSEMTEINGLQLIGLEYMNADRQTYDSHMVNDLTIEEELPKIQRSSELPSLLAHHSPVGLQYVSEGNIDVMLSGHTHGGQVFPGTILIALRFPMAKGRHQAGGTTLLVSQGAGTFGPWMRLGTFNEVQFVKLVPSQ
jgi:predicted MPP superfamily phosphohydrolase